MDFPGAQSFAPLSHAKGRGLDAASRQPFRRTPTPRAGPTLQKLSACATLRSRAAGSQDESRCSAIQKTCTKPVRRNWYRFGAISASLHQFCPVEQLFSPRLRATFERKLKYETVHTIVYPENPSRDRATGQTATRRNLAQRETLGKTTARSARLTFCGSEL